MIHIDCNIVEINYLTFVFLKYGCSPDSFNTLECSQGLLLTIRLLIKNSAKTVVITDR